MLIVILKPAWWNYWKPIIWSFLHSKEIQNLFNILRTYGIEKAKHSETTTQKNGDLKDFGNWRGIRLLSVLVNLFCVINLSRIRIRSAIDERLREEQEGFRPERSCTYQLFVLI